MKLLLKVSGELWRGFATEGPTQYCSSWIMSLRGGTTVWWRNKKVPNMMVAPYQANTRDGNRNGAGTIEGASGTSWRPNGQGRKAVGIQDKMRGSTVDKRDFVTVALMKVTHSVVHRP